MTFFNLGLLNSRMSAMQNRIDQLEKEVLLGPLGITDADEEAVGEMLKRVKDKGIEKRGLLTQEEFREIVDTVRGVRL